MAISKRLFYLQTESVGYSLIHIHILLNLVPYSVQKLVLYKKQYLAMLTSALGQRTNEFLQLHITLHHGITEQYEKEIKTKKTICRHAS
jgi:hypothetical protein